MTHIQPYAHDGYPEQPVVSQPIHSRYPLPVSPLLPGLMSNFLNTYSLMDSCVEHAAQNGYNATSFHATVAATWM